MSDSHCNKLAFLLITLAWAALPSSAESQTKPTTALPKTFADQWPSLRGPGGYGVAKPANTMTKWDVKTGEGILWSATVPVAGNNSPIVWRDHVFMSGADDKRQSVFCFDANTGKQLWTSPHCSGRCNRSRVTDRIYKIDRMCALSC